MSTVYLITGANRGLGVGFVRTYLQRPSTTIIAAVRDPSSASSLALTSLPKGPNSHLITVKIDSTSSTDALAAASSLAKHPITHIDVLIANAGIATDYSRVDAVDLAVVQQHIDVNVYGVLRAFQAFLPLLRASSAPKLVALGSPLGSITGMDQRPFPSAAYGPSKAMLHWYVRKISFENPEITSLIVDPGFVKTDMGNTGAKMAGLEEAFTEVEDAIGGLVKIVSARYEFLRGRTNLLQIDGATREKEGLVISTFDGTLFPF